MGRVLGPLVFLALVAVSIGIRMHQDSQASALFDGEAAGRETCRAIEALSRPIVDGGAPHPGLPALFDDLPALRPLPVDVGETYTFAQDASYVYGLSTRVLRDGRGQARHDYILRAWPREFGVTGDLEFLIQDGVFWEGRNRLGRSGTEVGFPPPFPAAELVEGPPWWPVDGPDTDSGG